MDPKDVGYLVGIGGLILVILLLFVMLLYEHRRADRLERKLHEKIMQDFESALLAQTIQQRSEQD